MREYFLYQDLKDLEDFNQDLEIKIDELFKENLSIRCDIIQ